MHTCTCRYVHMHMTRPKPHADTQICRYVHVPFKRTLRMCTFSYMHLTYCCSCWPPQV